MTRRTLAVLGSAMAPLAVLLAWANHAVAPLPEGTRATRVLVEKRARRLTLLRDAEVLRSYRIALGGRPEGHKLREGDNRTPEGVYRIDWRNPNSGWHLSLHLSYPDEADRARAAAAGVPPGGDILIHGLHNGFWWIGRLHRRRDWTRGCIAVTDPEIEEIWRVVPNGTPIEIRP